MSMMLHWGASGLGILLYAYVVGTLLWLILVAPGLYRRQRDLARRVEQLERQVAAYGSEHRTI